MVGRVPTAGDALDGMRSRERLRVSVRRAALVTLALAVAGGAAAAPASAPCPASDTAPQLGLPAAERLAPVRAYIRQGWKTLTRSHADLPAALPDSKVPHAPGTPWLLYVAASEDPTAVRSALAADLSPEQMAGIRVALLPPDARDHVDQIAPHGLLYLPHPYVVPGGRFNEMYGWDSYFIQVGLLRDGEIELARDMVDNFVYEIEHYGTILNANRTYYLTRSQPPFLTTMILGVFEKTHDRAWLATTLPAVESYYNYWTQPPHLVPELGLSRYHGLGHGPAPEVVHGERDAQGRSHYDRVREFYATTPVTAYDVSTYYDAARDTLRPLFFVGDRAMRESGFDPSNRFGPFSVDIVHYAPVGLNALLYRMEAEAARITTLLGRPDESAVWADRARRRQALVNQLLWDASDGLYRDYDFARRRLSAYDFATTFYPLWVGLAGPEQARRVASNLYRFEAPGGLLTSTTTSGSQWDAPFGWAPLQLIAAQGLRRYGYCRDADRLSAKFIGLVAKEFEEHSVIVEKYDVVQRQSDVRQGLRFGYGSNEIGFGWTNAVFIELAAEMGEATWPIDARPLAAMMPSPPAPPATMPPVDAANAP